MRLAGDAGGAVADRQSGIRLMTEDHVAEDRLAQEIEFVRFRSSTLVPAPLP